MNLTDLFPDGEHRFQLTLRRGQPREFFAHHDDTGRVLTERRRWLDAEPERYALLEPAGEPLLREFLEMAGEWKAIGAGGDANSLGVREAGALFEPDLLFLSADENGEFRLRGGALCFERVGIGGKSAFARLRLTMSCPAEPYWRPQSAISERMSPAAYLRITGACRHRRTQLHPSRGIPPAAPVDLRRYGCGSKSALLGWRSGEGL